ncbi:hypothetical protein DNTS_017533 [Danionella cerebrum]|uniref:B30.2/SPRY domain-containing protein n=1 Tax=Danionella cerebrum TaxID=2873325 RepID=A0A553QK10_9TELE|nr:hypothetical protein DNTS_017533 [Danionella translucida]
MLLTDWMGLSLSVWLRDSHLVQRDTSTSSSSSSPFHLFSITPPIRLAVLLATPPVAPNNPCSQWSPSHLSPNLQVNTTGGCVYRHHVAQSSDAVRGATGARTGLHLWEVKWARHQRGSHALLGVSTHECPTQASGYKVLIGGDSASWGWDLVTNQLWHDGKARRDYPGGGALQVPDRVLLVVDADAGTLGFVVDGCFLGTAFQDLAKGVELFPAVSCVWGGAEICIRYLCGTKRDAPALQDLSRLSVHRALRLNKDQNHDRKQNYRYYPAAVQRLLLLTNPPLEHTPLELGSSVS